MSFLMQNPLIFKSSIREGNSSEKFLGITIDRNFAFEKHINELCKKKNLKLHALTRCAKIMRSEKTCLIFKSLIIFQLFPFSVDVLY